MVSTAKRGNVLLAAALAVAVSGFGTSRAEAQWGFGWGGFGFGGGLYTYVPQPVTQIDQYTMARMGHVHGPTQNNVYSGNPNAYYNHIRDNGFVDRYYPDRREPSYYGYSSRSRPQQTTPTAATMVRVKPIVPLTSFYNDKNELVWPGDAPKDGDLKEKRSAFDKASLAVLEETKKGGSATIGSVTEARRKLVDYGRPALDYVKAHETPRVADSFHGFLLSLYDSLAQAANPPSGP